MKNNTKTMILALAVCLLTGPALAEEAAGIGEEELFAVEETFAITEEEPLKLGEAPQ